MSIVILNQINYLFIFFISNESKCIFLFQFNIACPETGRNKVVELQNEEKMSNFIDQKIGAEIDGESISSQFNGYVFKITGGTDKDGFGMKNGVLSTERKQLLLDGRTSGIRFYRIRYRPGAKIRKTVRGCIVSSDIKMVNLKIVKVGENPIKGLTTQEDAQPKRLGPKRARKILKDVGLLDIYEKKMKQGNEKKTLRYMITKLVNKRTVTTSNGKTYSKAPKVQRLITPLRIRRKNLLKKLRKENSKYTREQKKEYENSYKKRGKGKKTLGKNTKSATPNTTKTR